MSEDIIKQTFWNVFCEAVGLNIGYSIVHIAFKDMSFILYVHVYV